MKLKYISAFNTFYKLQWNIDKRLLELDMKSVIRQGNDGVLRSAHVLCAFSMKFKERHLKILILPDQLLPGKDLIGLDALKAVPSLFIHDRRPRLGGEIPVPSSVCDKLFFPFGLGQELRPKSFFY